MNRLKNLFYFSGLLGWSILGFLSLNLFFSDIGLRYDKYDLALDMLGIAAWALWALCGYFLYYLRKRNKALLPFEMFFVFFFFLVLPGLILVDVNITEYHRIGFLLSLIISAIIFSFFALLTSAKLKTAHLKYIEPPRIYLQYTTITIIFCFLLVFIIGGSGGGFWSNIVSIVINPDGIDNSVDLARKAVYEGDRSSLYVLRYYLTNTVIPVLAATLLMISKQKNRKYYFIFSVTSIVLCIVITMGSGSRLQFTRQILFMAFVFVSMGFVNFKYVFYSAGIVVVLLVLSTSALNRIVGTESAIDLLSKSLNRVAERVFLTKGASSMMGVEYTVTSNTWPRYGGTYTNYFSTANNGDYFSAQVHQYAYGRPGTAGPQALVEGYINGSMLGVLLTSLGIFFVLSVMAVLLSKVPLGLPYCGLLFLSFAFAYSGYSHTFAFQALGVVWGGICYFLFFLFYRLIKGLR